MSQLACNFSQIISQSFERTLWILFKPFSLKKWFFLLLIAWLAGALGSGGSFNVGDWSRDDKAEAYPVREPSLSYNAVDQSSQTAPTLAPEERPDRPVPVTAPDTDDAKAVQPAGEKECGKAPFCLNTRMTMILVMLFVFLGLPILLLFTWLSARFKFVWYEAIVTNDVSVIRPFEKYSKEGNSLFFCFLIYTFIWWAALFLLGWMTYLNARSAGVFNEEFAWSIGIFFQLFGLPLVLSGLLVLFGLVALFVIDHFLVPIMAFDKIPCREGFKKLGRMYVQAQKEFWLFLLISFGLSILFGIMSFVLVMMIVVVFAIAAFIIFGLLFLLLGVLLKMKILFGILAVILGIPYVFLFLILLVATALPFAVFFRNLSLYFITDIDGGQYPLLASLSSPQSSPAPPAESA
jgi:hypothetical protein